MGLADPCRVSPDSKMNFMLIRDQDYRIILEMIGYLTGTDSGVLIDLS